MRLACTSQHPPAPRHLPASQHPPTLQRLPTSQRLPGRTRSSSRSSGWARTICRRPSARMFQPMSSPPVSGPAIGSRSNLTGCCCRQPSCVSGACGGRSASAGCTVWGSAAVTPIAIRPNTVGGHSLWVTCAPRCSRGSPMLKPALRTSSRPRWTAAGALRLAAAGSTKLWLSGSRRSSAAVPDSPPPAMMCSPASR